MTSFLRSRGGIITITVVVLLLVGAGFSFFWSGSPLNREPAPPCSGDAPRCINPDLLNSPSPEIPLNPSAQPSSLTEAEGACLEAINNLGAILEANPSGSIDPSDTATMDAFNQQLSSLNSNCSTQMIEEFNTQWLEPWMNS